MKKMKHRQNKGVSHEEDEALRKHFKGVANTTLFLERDRERVLLGVHKDVTSEKLYRE